MAVPREHMSLEEALADRRGDRSSIYNTLWLDTLDVWKLKYPPGERDRSNVAFGNIHVADGIDKFPASEQDRKRLLVHPDGAPRDPAVVLFACACLWGSAIPIEALDDALLSRVQAEPPADFTQRYGYPRTSTTQGPRERECLADQLLRLRGHSYGYLRLAAIWHPALVPFPDEDAHAMLTAAHAEAKERARALRTRYAETGNI